MQFTQVPTSTPTTDFVNSAWLNLLRAWHEAKDLESLDVAISEVVYFQFASVRLVCYYHGCEIH